MRTAYRCHEHRGGIAKCSYCQNTLHYEKILDNAIKRINGDDSFKYDRMKRRLESYVYECQKDFDWYLRDRDLKARRLFMANALYNTHGILHSARCFKKENTCYSDFPRLPNEELEVAFSETPSTWSTFNGLQVSKWIFEPIHLRKLEDCYTNIHNTLLTSLF